MANEGLSKERQKLLITLLGCGLTQSEIHQISGINPITIKKYRKRFIAEGHLSGPISPGTKYAHVWHVLNDGEVFEPISAQLLRQIVLPFEAKLRLVFVHPIYLEPKTPLERLWVKLYGSDEGQLWARVEALIGRMMSPANWDGKCYRYPTDAEIFDGLAKEFRLGDHLPDWPSRHKALEKAISKLNQQEQEVIRLRFVQRNRLTQLEVGKQIGVSAARVGQVENKAFKQLQALVLRAGLSVGTIGELRSKFAGATGEVDAQKAEIITLKKPKETFAAMFNEIKAAVNRAEQVLAPETEPEFAFVYEVRFEELDFSQRTFNCLRRAGLVTLRLLAAADEHVLTSIRGFGERSLAEVREKLRDYGLELKPRMSYSSDYNPLAHNDTEEY